MKYVLLFLFLFACSSAPDEVASTSAGAGGGTAGDMSGLFGGHGGSSVFTLDDGGEAGTGGSSAGSGGSGGALAGDAGPDAQAPDAGTFCEPTCPWYERCITGACASCEILADDFARPDSKDLGAPQVPEGVLWEPWVGTLPPGVTYSPDYDIVDGGVVNLYEDPHTGYFHAKVNTFEDAVRLKFAVTLGAEPFVFGGFSNIGGGGRFPSVGVSLDAFVLSGDATQKHESVFDPEAIHYIEFTVEGVLTGVGTGTATIATSDYASDGGDILATLKTDVYPYEWDRVSIFVRKTSRIEEISLERYPCTP